LERFMLTREQALLMVIDIQERLVPVMKYKERVIENTNILISTAKNMDIPIIATEQYPKGLGKTVPEITDNLGEVPTFEKVTFSCCTPEVISSLEQFGKRKIIITGMETHVCVFQTVRDLLSRGYQVFVVKDAVCSRATENYRNGLSLMSEMGAVITNTETILFDLMQKAGTPEFKELSKLIK